MKMDKRSLLPLSKNKALAIFLLIVSVFGFLVIIHRLSYYVYEFDPKYSPINYGKYNILCYFTVQSNIFVCFYLLLLSLGMLGVKKVQKIAFSEITGTLITTYILLTGIIYCCGIPLGFTAPYKWDTPNHSMLSFIQIFHHMIIPPLMVILWLCPMTNKKVQYKKLWVAGIYPLIYSIFSIVRGAVSATNYYVYPFYNPQFLWDLFMGEREMSMVAGYVLMFPVLVVGIGLFIGTACLLALLHNKRIDFKMKKA